MIPKAELHVHLEGTAPPQLVRKLADRNGVTLPANLFHDDGAFHWRDFGHFLEVYVAASSVIKTPEDYRDVTYEYLASCAAEGAIYVEVMSSPDHAAAAGMSYQDHLEGIVAGIRDAARDHNIEGRLIVTCVRHFGVERAMEVARQVVATPHDLLVGFGMGGDEAAWPPGQFSAAFNYATSSGLPCTVHAGEWAGPAQIREAIVTLPVKRLGHGVRAIEDPALVQELSDRGIALEVCPGSNIATGLYATLEEHPIRRLIEAGVTVTLNSDDPPYFATSIGREYDNAESILGLSSTQLCQITRAAINASFADDQTKARLLASMPLA
ncbi:MAG: adenosine deaminase [Alphaproteobacteria bacterium]|nr:adenosine deaminase [Alphaproteobacteria bacterium]